MEMVKTTVELSRDLYTQAKMMALLTRKPMAHLIRIALAEKIKQLKAERMKNEHPHD
jgi:hypothetical protein